MYNMDQIAAMKRNSLIDVLNDAEKCLNSVQQELIAQNNLKAQRENLLAECENIKKKIKKFPFIPGIVVAAILVLVSRWFLILLGIIVAVAILYKRSQRPVLESQLADVENKQIPAVDMRIRQSEDNLRALTPWAMNVKSLLALLPDNRRDLVSICGIRDQLMRGAQDWYTATQGYESVVAREEQARQMREMQSNVQQMTVNTERTASAAEDVRKYSEDIAQSSARTAAAAEAAAANSARAAAAAQSSAQSQAKSARAAERTAAASERTAAAAEDAAYWIRNYL